MINADETSPRIHGNGTRPQVLKDKLEAVWDALEVALVRFRECAPNPRDYDDEAHYDAARDQHAERVAAVRVVQNSIEREMDAIDQQVQRLRGHVT